ncbi:hypothetical protein [Synechococcus sp. UW105]|uniref:Hfq-related RNA-binding protein n=1 Tax=Synechococcus sp. UW105 TaxID=337067 RepID=UPI000E0F5126|nr:hypothetical protein [Synechococcus sp. UW105]
MNSTHFDPSLPGVRQLQAWTREQRLLRIELLNGSSHEGVLLWQDPEFLAVLRSDASEPILITRRSLTLIRPLG